MSVRKCRPILDLMSPPSQCYFFLPVNGYSPSRRAAIKAQSRSLLQVIRTLPNLVSNDSSHRAKEFSTKIDKGQKFSS